MGIVKIKDKTFETSIPESQILERVKAVADRINADMDGKNPLLIAVLNGSFIFAADLMRGLTIPCEISFVKLASYEGTASTGSVRQLLGLGTPIEGRHVIVVEDIVESGLTMKGLLGTLAAQHPASVEICTLLLKPERLKVPLDIKYVAFSIPNDFILGYGLDYDQQGRQLRDIYTLKQD